MGWALNLNNMNEKKYTPLEDRVLIEEIKSSELEKTEGGLYKAGEKPELYGVVKRIGKGRFTFETGDFIETTLKEGDNVIFGKGVGMPIELDLDGDKKEYVLMREADVLMKI